jgi:hypothetical protein
VFRKHTRLPLDSCWARLKTIIPDLSRSALHRCLRRYRVSRVPPGRREGPSKARNWPDHGHFSIEVHRLLGESDQYLCSAIDKVRRVVFAKVMDAASADATSEFLIDLIKHSPLRVGEVETNNHRAFVNPDRDAGDPNRRSTLHPFSRACIENGISHHVTEWKDPSLKVVSKGWGRVPARRSKDH